MTRIEIIPDATRTLTGLAHQGYTPQTAIADLVDNSISAGASIIKVMFAAQPNGSTVVSIADNGCGMNEETLIAAMQIGSSSGLANSSLSVYGMGMKAASMSFSRKFTVVSRGDDGIAHQASWDLDEQSEHPWSIDLVPADERHRSMLDRLVDGSTGTVVVWEKADFKDAVLENRKIKGRKPNSSQIETIVKEYLAMVFHRYLVGAVEGFSGINIFFNEERIEPWDPFSPEFLSSEWKKVKDEFEINVEVNGKIESVPYSIETYLLLGKGEAESDVLARSKVGMKLQGIYPYREDRLLQSPDWLNTLTFHPDLNGMRVIFEIDPRLDAVTRTDMKKSGLALPPEMWENIRGKLEIYANFIRSAKKERNKKERAKAPTALIHKGSNKAITAALPEIEKPITSMGSDGTTHVKTMFGESVTELPIVETILTANEKRIHAVEDLEGGVLFEPRMQGAELVLYVNKQHPFYQKIYLGVYDTPLAVQGLDFLLYSLAHAELLTRTDRIKEQFRRMRNEMSNALRSFVEDIDEPDDDLLDELNTLG